MLEDGSDTQPHHVAATLLPSPSDVAVPCCCCSSPWLAAGPVQPARVMLLKPGVWLHHDATQRDVCPTCGVQVAQPLYAPRAVCQQRGHRPWCGGGQAVLPGRVQRCQLLQQLPLAVQVGGLHAQHGWGDLQHLHQICRQAQQAGSGLFHAVCIFPCTLLLYIHKSEIVPQPGGRHAISGCSHTSYLQRVQHVARRFRRFPGPRDPTKTHKVKQHVVSKCKQ
jgi:hypothetical protein